MTAVNSVLIVGGGTAGCALGTLLARGGVEVQIAEIKTDGTAHGSGITLQGNALRVLDEIGVWPQVRDRGFPFDGLAIRSHTGAILAEIDDQRTGGPDLPATTGMNRPQLATILSDAAKQAGAIVRLGVTVRTLHRDASGVNVTFDDGAEGRYDLVVGADGIRSRMRSLLGIEQQPQPTGMSIWRVRARRPAGLERTDLCYDGSSHLAGYCPTSDDTTYAYLVENTRTRTHLPRQEQLELVRRLAGDYRGFWDDIRDDLTDPGDINYTAFESLLVPAPWNRGRAVLIGDAAHACPPTLAQGAAMCLEDASVLAELLLTSERVDESLWRSFVDRRFARVQAIVEGSLQIVRWMAEDDPDADVPGLMARITDMVGQPA